MQAACLQRCALQSVRSKSSGFKDVAPFEGIGAAQRMAQLLLALAFADWL